MSGCSHGYTTAVAGQGGQWQRLSPACNFSPETQTWTSPWMGRAWPRLGESGPAGPQGREHRVDVLCLGLSPEGTCQRLAVWP